MGLRRLERSNLEYTHKTNTVAVGPYSYHSKKKKKHLICRI